jgi:hypothetical protein
MSITARIERVTETPEGYDLELCGPAYDQGDGFLVAAPPGQSHLTIVNPTWRPEVGMSIWGGSDTVIIEATPRRTYRRVGYTRLQEQERDGIRLAFHFDN